MVEEEDRGSCDGDEEGETCPSSVCACHVFQCVSVAVRLLDPVSSPFSLDPSPLRPPLSSMVCSSTDQSSLLVHGTELNKCAWAAVCTHRWSDLPYILSLSVYTVQLRRVIVLYNCTNFVNVQHTNGLQMAHDHTFFAVAAGAWKDPRARNLL